MTSSRSETAMPINAPPIISTISSSRGWGSAAMPAAESTEYPVLPGTTWESRLSSSGSAPSSAR